MTWKIRERNRNQQGSGCLKFFLFVALLFVIILSFGAYYTYRHAPELARSSGALTIETVFEKTLTGMHYTEEEKQRTMAEVRVLSEKIRSGDVSLAQAQEVLRSLHQGAVFTLMFLHGIEKEFLEQSSLSAEEKTDGRQSLERFAAGLATGKIPQQQAQQLIEAVADQAKKNSASPVVVKQSLTPNELRTLLAEAKSAADQAQIPPDSSAADLAQVLQAAIKNGLQKP